MTWHVVGVDLPPATLGGVAAWTADAGAALADAGHRVVVYARHDGDTTAWDRSRPHAVVRMRGRSWVRRQAAWAAIAVGPRLRRGDTLLCATWTVATALRPLAAALSVPLLVGAHGSELTTWAAPPRALLGLGPHARWLPVSRFLSAELDRLGGRGWRRHVAPMPLDPGAAPPEGPRSGLVCLARDTPLKGLDRAIGLARAVGEPLLLLGATGDGAHPGVQATGPLPREAARAALARARAAVLLPRTRADGRGAEGLGLALLEAAAAGTPAIGCHTGGVPEAVGPGLLLETPDAPDAAAVRAWLAGPNRGTAARAWVEAHHGPAAFRAAVTQALA